MGPPSGRPVGHSVALSQYIPDLPNPPSPFDANPQPVHQSSRRKVPPSSRKTTKRSSLLTSISEIAPMAEGVSATVSQPLSRGLSVYPPSGHGPAMVSTSSRGSHRHTPVVQTPRSCRCLGRQPSPNRVQHVAAEQRRHRPEPRQPTVQSVPPPQKLQTLHPQDREWTKSGSLPSQIQGEGDGWQPRDLKGVPHSSGCTLFDSATPQVIEDTPALTFEAMTPPPPTETIPDVVAGASEGFDINRHRQNRQQSNYLRTRQDGASVPPPNRYPPDTNDDISITSDEENDNFSERFFDVDRENYNGPCSLKTISKRSFSTWSFRSTRSTFSTDSSNISWVYD
ncbi:hypothetical protein BC826DRAFT_522739 [Russula brevipes]|nr:hypothetical protein BC826DRAFT_522739 [Russula brevipes]